MTNRGVAPPDPATDVGKLRITIGDVEYKELNPPEAGYGDYENFSDEELQALLDASDGSILRAAGFAYLKLATASTGEAFDFKSDDLSVSMSQRAGGLFDIARYWFDLADQQDARETVEYHNFVPFRGGCHRGPEYAWAGRVRRQHW